MRGKLIVFEGIDGSGKCSQTKMLADHLRGQGRRVATQAFPVYESITGKLILEHLHGAWAVRYYLTPTGTTVSSLPDMVVRQALMTINRYEQAQTIQGMLDDGVDVVLDRYWMSSVAYGEVEGLDVTWILRISAMLPKPDASILLDLSVRETQKRLAARDRPRDLNEQDAVKLERVRQVYKDLFCGPMAHPDNPMKPVISALERAVVDASASPDVVHHDVLQMLDLLHVIPWARPFGEAG